MILVCSSGKESGHSRMYVWQDMRKACPFDLSPSYSLGNARGGGHPVGASQMGVMLVGGVSRVLTGFNSRMRSSKCWKPFMSAAS